MSLEAVTWALRVPVGGSAKVVLLGLANHAHPDGTESYPSLDTLAEYANCDRTTARRNARRLLAEGWITDDGKGPKGTTKYRLRMDRTAAKGWQNATPEQPAKGWQNATPDAGEGVAPGSEGGGTGVRQGVAPVPPEPSKNRPEPSTAAAAPRAHARGAATPGGGGKEPTTWPAARAALIRAGWTADAVDDDRTKICADLARHQDEGNVIDFDRLGEIVAEDRAEGRCLAQRPLAGLRWGIPALARPSSKPVGRGRLVAVPTAVDLPDPIGHARAAWDHVLQLIEEDGRIAGEWATWLAAVRPLALDGDVLEITAQPHAADWIRDRLLQPVTEIAERAGGALRWVDPQSAAARREAA